MDTKHMRRKLEDGAPIGEVIGAGRRNKAQADLLGSFTQGKSGLFPRLGLKVPDLAGRGPLVPKLVALQGWRLVLAMVVTALLGFVPALVANFEGNLVRVGLQPDMAHDVGYWNQFVISMTLLVFLMSYYFGGLPEVLARLAASDTLEIGKGPWDDFCDYSRQVGSHWAVWVLPLVAGSAALATGLLVYGFSDRASWQSPVSGSRGTWANLAHAPLIFFHWYFIASAVARVIAIHFVLKRFFAFPVKIQPLHPDGCGGLAELGRWSGRITAAAFVYGAVLVAGIYSNKHYYEQSVFHPLNVSMVLGYVAVATLVFFLPLWPVHRRMDAAKYAACDSINSGFEAANEAVMKTLRNGDRLKRSRVRELLSLQKLHAVVEKMPVYPFDAATLRGFFVSILIPTLGFLSDFFDVAGRLARFVLPGKQ